MASDSEPPPSQLSDEALLSEVMRRRRERGLATPEDPAQRGLSPDAVQRHMASLELEGEPDHARVQQAYETLRGRYEPYTKHDDSERAAAARTLLESLEQAFEALRQHLSA